MRVLGVDPGQDGGISLLETTPHGAFLYGWGEPMPTSGRQKKTLDVHAIAMLCREAKADLAVVEQVHALPRQGASSTFKFGSNYGVIIGVLGTLGVRTELVSPQRWKGVVLHGTERDKDAAIAWCRRAYPQVSLVPQGKRVPHDGIADALCMAEFGRRTFS